MHSRHGIYAASYQPPIPPVLWHWDADSERQSVRKADGTAATEDGDVVAAWDSALEGGHTFLSTGTANATYVNADGKWGVHSPVNHAFLPGPDLSVWHRTIFLVFSTRVGSTLDRASMEILWKYSNPGLRGSFAVRITQTGQLSCFFTYSSSPVYSLKNTNLTNPLPELSKEPVYKPMGSRFIFGFTAYQQPGRLVYKWVYDDSPVVLYHDFFMGVLGAATTTDIVDSLRLSNGPTDLIFHEAVAYQDPVSDISMMAIRRRLKEKWM